MTEHDMRQPKRRELQLPAARARTHARARTMSRHLEHTRNTLLKLIVKYVLSIKRDLKGKGKQVDKTTPTLE